MKNAELAQEIFNQYAPFVQEFIYSHEWESLRGVQIAAGDALFNTEDNVLITASTAAGKTEAAFFPILTDFVKRPPKSVGCLYISPLKALINDQFERLDGLCATGGIPVWHWHGDVSSVHKAKLLVEPSGILQITPESLEAMLINRRMDLRRMFADLRYVVIDEVHSLLGGERGGQTFSLINRLCRLVEVQPRRIGLSATLGEPERVAKYLGKGSGRGTVVPKVEGAGQKLRLGVEYYGYEEGGDDKEGGENEEVVSEEMVDYIYKNSFGKKCLVFCNTRTNCEAITRGLRAMAERRKEPNRFLIHHGSLSRSVRESTEFAMKSDDSMPTTTVATATLELGIDIGRMERAFQCGAPASVATFLQRLGRTGRRNNVSEMICLIQDNTGDESELFPQTLPWELLECVAVITLYLEEKWVEPNYLDRPSLSLLFHQTMSVLAAEGECSPAVLAERILLNPVFQTVPQDDYRELLKYLLETEMIERMDDGKLLLGLNGERLVNNYKFYAVFIDEVLYTVRSGEQTVGMIWGMMGKGDQIGLAGQSWEVDDVDEKRKILYCHPVRAKVRANFVSKSLMDRHTKVVRKMKEILLRDEKYGFLSEKAQARLESAQKSFRKTVAVKVDLLEVAPKAFVLMPWLGTRTMVALYAFMSCSQGELGITQVVNRENYLEFKSELTGDEIKKRMKREVEKFDETIDLPDEILGVVVNKYDGFVPQALRQKWIAKYYCDIKGMKEYVSGM